MTPSTRRRCPRSSMAGAGGQSTVEFALLLPLVVAVAGAVVQVGVVARDQLMVVHAAREAARVASVDPDVAHVRAAAQRVVPGATVRVDARPRVGEPIAVHVVARVATTVPVIGSLVPDLTLDATATMLVER